MIRVVDHISLYVTTEELSTLVLETTSLKLVDTDQHVTAVVCDDGVAYAHGATEVAKLLKLIPTSKRKHVVDSRGRELYRVIY